MKLEEGMVLLASQSLGAGFFRDALILIVVHNKDGAFGLILNRAAQMPVKEVFDPVPDVAAKSRIFYIGGPVDEDALHILTLTNSSDNNGYPFAPGVELGGSWDTIDELLETPEEECYLFLGYSGWGANQLEEELEEGSWILYDDIEIRPLLEELYQTPRGLNRVETELLLRKHKKGIA